MKRKTLNTLIALGVLSVLLGIRLVFFLKDGTNDTIESVLTWVIFVGSLGIFAYAFLYNPTYMHARWVPHLHSLLIAGALLVLDIAFIIKNGLDFDGTYLFSVFLILYVVFLCFSFLKPRTRRVFEVAIMILFAFYLFAQDVYFNIFNDLFSFKEGGTLREGAESSQDMVHINAYHAFIVLIVSAVFYLKHKLPKPPLKRGPFLQKVTSVFLLLALINLNADYPVKLARLHTSDHYLYTSVYSKRSFVGNYGSLNLVIRDLSKTLAPDFSLRHNTEFLDHHFMDLDDPHEQNPMSGIFKDKNLLMVVGESFDGSAVHETLTPNLYKLKHEGWDFKNHYVPVFPRTTCDSEVILNTSLIPSIEDGPTCYVYNTNSYRTSLANRFRDSGYTTRAFHNNHASFYTRELVYEGFGYDAFYGQEAIGLSETEKRYDTTFFERSKDLMIKGDGKFMSFALTLSGHSPYTEDNSAIARHYDAVDAYHGEQEHEAFKHYVAAQIELDRMVGAILEDLETKNLLEETVIVLTTDHHPYTLDQAVYEDKLGITEDYEKAHGPLYIYHEGITPMTYDALSVSFDLLPTLLNLFGIESDYRYYMGRDLFSEEPSVVYYKDYALYASKTYFHLSDTIPEGMESIYQHAMVDYEVSKRILRSDYLSTDHGDLP